MNIKTWQEVSKQFTLDRRAMATNQMIWMQQEIDELRAAYEALKAESAAQAKRIAHLEYKIDELMLEWCPDEMTPEQLENYAKHQRKVSL